MKPRHLLALLLGVSVFGSVVGCDKKKEETSSSSSSESKDDKEDKKDKKGKDKKDDDDKSDKKKDDDKDKGKKPEKVELVETDLSSVAAWKGWSISAPKGAKVSEDGTDLRVAGKSCDKCPYFDLILSQKKPDLTATKKLHTDEAAKGKDKINFTESTTAALEWTYEAGDKKSYNFVHIVKVGTDEIGCWPDSSVNAEADFDVMKDACETIAKK